MKIKSIKDLEESYFDRQESISWWRQEDISNAKVLVVGAGATGNEVIKNLTLLGFPCISICDFDTISTSNLSRTVLFGPSDLGRRKSEVAATRARAMALASDPSIAWFHGDVVWELGLGVFREADVVLGCLDNVEARLFINRMCRKTGTPWIDSGIHELGWHVSVFSPSGPCYECALSKQQRINARKRYSCDNVMRSSLVEGHVPTTQVAASIAAAIQVQEAVKIICGQSASYGRKIFGQGVINDFGTLMYVEKADCVAHVSLPPVHQIELSANDTVGQFLEIVESAVGAGAAIDLSAERSFLRSAGCRKCGRRIVFERPSYQVSDRDLICPQGCGIEEGGVVDGVPTPSEVLSVFSLHGTPDLMSKSLLEIGVPLKHVVPVRRKNGEYVYFELGADKPFIIV